MTSFRTLARISWLSKLTMCLVLVIGNQINLLQAQGPQPAAKGPQLAVEVPQSAAQAPQPAAQVLSDAQAVATKENKNVFVLFHASWCGWCRKMDTAMNDPLIKKYFDANYVVRHLVVLESKDKKALENPGALELMKKHSEESSGIPFWIVFDRAGKKLYDSRELSTDGKPGDNVGCPASENEVRHFINVLRGSSKIDEAGLLAITNRFRRIETGL